MSLRQTYYALNAHTGSNNSINAIALAGLLTNPDVTTTLEQNPLPYFLTDSSPTVSQSSTLIIKTGTTIKGDKKLIINGNLIIDGINPTDILFTSKFDDNSNGDTTNDGNSSSPQAGDFPGIHISNTGTLNAKGFTMKYAGGTGYGSNDSAGITVDGGLATILNATISNNYSHGINAQNFSQINIENAQFENHNQVVSWGVKSAFRVSNSTATLTNVTFSNNQLGIKSDTLSTFITSGINWINNILNTIPDNLF